MRQQHPHHQQQQQHQHQHQPQSPQDPQAAAAPPPSQQQQQQQPPPPQPPPQPSDNTSQPHNNRMAADPRHRGPLPVPSAAGPPSMQNGHGHQGHGHGHGRPGQPMPPNLDMARSPPNPPPAKNTKHVPCKFFRQGACQAGPACPFLHSTDATADSVPCKYFTKGNCKFGIRCALAHVLPDGRRVNRPNFSPGMGPGNLNLGGRVNPQPHHAQDSALANSLLSQQQQQQQQHQQQPPPGPPQPHEMNGHGSRYSYPFAGQDEMHNMQGPPQPPPQLPQHYDGIPTIDAGHLSETGSKYGSPADDGRMPMSPIGRTALDAPLPASFDSQGISYMARNGPVAASLPSKFGREASSSPSQPFGGGSDALRSLHDTAFGSDWKRQKNLGSSPSGLDDATTPRLMHSQRLSRPKMLSSSLPRPTTLDDLDDNLPLEEDYLPADLHDDVLTPQERMRRLSRTEQDNNKDPTGLGSGKVGSPLASSPSRFGALFAKQRQKKEEEAQAGLGHVGSPLRESSLQPRSSPSTRPVGSRPNSGDISPFVASPSRQSSMSMISQQLSSTSLHPNAAARHGTGARLDRAVSSPVSTTRIVEEEEGDLVFSMEEEDGSKRTGDAWNRSKSPTSEQTATQ